MSPGSALYVGAVDGCAFSVADGVAAYKSDLVVCMFGHAPLWGSCSALLLDECADGKISTHPLAWYGKRGKAQPASAQNLQGLPAVKMSNVTSEGPARIIFSCCITPRLIPSGYSKP